MLFNSYEFIFIYLPIVLFVYFLLNHFGRFQWAKASLFLASLFFYGYNKPSYVVIILTSIVLNYTIGGMLKKFSAYRKPILFTGILMNILLLGYFKYFDFLIESMNSVLGCSFDLLNIALPLGISFFTFQQISFLVDTSRGECSEYTFLDYALFVTFFPQLVAGPIVSHDEMLPQFHSEKKKTFDYDNFSKGIRAFAIGLFKKVIIADNLGKIVEYGYTNTASLNSLEAVLTILSYTFQIYNDFSGYCDMASGIAYMFNIELPQNFDSPYKAKTILEFWKRWHITLTRFLTKYIYIPLGGNRKGRIRTYINIFLVYLISGIWHGAGYTFIIWGIMHGLASIMCRIFKKYVEKIPDWINWLITFAFINLSWIAFRAENVRQMVTLLSRVVSGGFSINAELTETMLQPFFINILSQFIPIHWVLIFFILLVCGVSICTKNTKILTAERNQTWGNLIWTCFLFLISITSISGVSTFLYFNF